MEYTSRALGQQIKVLREELGLSQETFGNLAGYGKGAGVSISRIESGTTRPSRQSLPRIAEALGIAPERLEQLAGIRNTEAETKLDTSAVGRRLAIERRKSNIEERTKSRTECAEDLAALLEIAHDRARETFFLKFLKIAKDIEGAQHPSESLKGSLPSAGEDASTAEAINSLLSTWYSDIAKLIAGGAGGATIGAGVGHAAAYATYAGVARLGTASTGAPIAGLSGIAAANATLSKLGGGTLASGGRGVAGGNLVLTSIVAAPIGLMFAGGVYLAHRLNKARAVKLNAELDRAEALLDSTQKGFELLTNTISRATASLNYIGVHAAHALDKWEQGLGARPIPWSSLTCEQSKSYVDFFQIAACELAVNSIDAAQFMAVESDDLDHLAGSIVGTFDQIDRRVRTLV